MPVLTAIDWCVAVVGGAVLLALLGTMVYVAGAVIVTALTSDPHGSP